MLEASEHRSDHNGSDATASEHASPSMMTDAGESKRRAHDVGSGRGRWSRILAALALGWFLLNTVQVLQEHSYVGFFLISNANSGTRLMMLDLVIALTLVMIWVVQDARRNGNSFAPVALITAPAA